MQPQIPVAISARLDALAAVAQSVYDQWDQSGPDGDPEFGFGGICQDIAEVMAGILNGHGIESASVPAQIGDQHVFVLARTDEGVFEIDIPPHVYEIGSGYVWAKKEGVIFTADAITVAKISAEPADFYEMSGCDADDFAP